MSVRMIGWRASNMVSGAEPCVRTRAGWTTEIRRWVVCASSETPVSLKVGKRYRVLEDREAEGQHLLRVVDESGESYLFPEAQFVEQSE